MFHMQDQEVKEDDYLEVDPESNEVINPKTKMIISISGELDSSIVVEYANLLKIIY